MLRDMKLTIPGATLSLALAGCAAAGPPPGADVAAPHETVPAFRATGNEPGWRLDIGSGEMTLLTNFGQDRLVVPAPTPQVAGATTRYVARTNQGELTATIVDRVCVDSMSGMPHPRTVTVVIGDRTLNGCGGEPASLLRGAEWAVDAIEGKPLVSGSQATLAFAPDGRLSGQASCNRFTSTYTLSGEGLHIAQAASTRMLCDDALMAQESSFLAILGSAQNFSIEADGALLLRAGDGRSIRARRR
jgi:heat shock protein HslJ